MKTGLSLQDMAKELQRRNTAKRDFIADTTALHLSADACRVVLSPSKGKDISLVPGETFRRQVAAHYKVPQDYAERIRGAHPELYAATLNTFFEKEPARRMVRVLDDTSRAFLSDRYRPLDNFDLANAVLPELMGRKDMKVESTQFTESRFYLKAVSSRIQTEVKKGDVVQIGLMVSNSEVGAGALQVSPLVYRLICLNGMVSPDYGQRRYHVGKRASGEEDTYQMYSDKTRQLDDAAFFAKVRDTVKGVLTKEVLEALVLPMREATEQKIASKDIPAVIEVTASTFGYGESTSANLLEHLIKGGDLTRYGLMNAITRASQDEDDYDTATRMEADGARLIELPQSDWRTIAEAESNTAARAKVLRRKAS